MKDIQSTGKVKALFLLMRPFQWVKNIILFLPMFFAQEIGDTDRLWNVAILFAGFCLLTSGVYIFNDLMDAGEDRLHPVKRFRPIASRKVSPMAALVFMFLLYATSALCFSFMYTSNNQIWLLSGGYILLNLAYTLYLKQVQIIDAMIVACGFIIRLEAGAAAGEIELSHWLIIMTFILSLFLAFAKRRDDLLNFMETGQISRFHHSRDLHIIYAFARSDVEEQRIPVCHSSFRTGRHHALSANHPGGEEQLQPDRHPLTGPYFAVDRGRLVYRIRFTYLLIWQSQYSTSTEPSFPATLCRIF